MRYAVHGVGLWKYIRKGWEIVQRHARFVVGADSLVRFWYDKLCGEQSLKPSLPFLSSHE